MITYDVDTTSKAGAKRLRKVALICQAYGQRVQKSVFECALSLSQVEQLRQRLTDAIDPAQDNLRIYRLLEPRSRYVEVLGRPLEHDLHDPLVL